MGSIGIKYLNPDHIPLVLANHILGEGPQSRLFMNLREDKGFTYDASSSVVMRQYAGPWYATTEVRNAVTAKALSELLLEFKNLRNKKYLFLIQKIGLLLGPPLNYPLSM